MQKMRGDLHCVRQKMQDFANADCMGKLQLDGKKTAKIRKKTCTICMNALQNGTRRLAADKKMTCTKYRKIFRKFLLYKRRAV